MSYTFSVHNEDNKIGQLSLSTSKTVGDLRNEILRQVSLPGWNSNTKFKLKLKNTEGKFVEIINNWDSFTLPNSPFGQWRNKQPIPISVTKNVNGGRKTRSKKQRRRRTMRAR